LGFHGCAAVAVSAPAVLGEQPRLGFEELYATHQPRVYRTCLAILRNHDDAAEATQEVFSRALPLLTGLREPHVWLQTVARNYCFDQLRRQKVRGPGIALDEETPGSLRDDPERETLLRDALRHAFDALSPRERRALARVLLMDDSLGEIAEMLGVSYGAAAQVVSRARRRAAVAARAVIGASFGWLFRVAVPHDRSRATRTAAQALESGQQILLAAAVLFTAGSMAHAATMAPASAGEGVVVPLGPAAAHRVGTAAPRVGQAPGHVPTAPAGVPSLPAGIVHDPIGSGIGYAPITANPSAPNDNGATQPVVVTVAPHTDRCKGADVTAGPASSPNTVDRSVVVCQP
jgi:RNA polymerase sigma-70 factor (ECF subfamily)